MQDPIGSFENIREFYLSYLDTAFRIGDENVAEERRRLLRAPGTLCTDPLIEPLPRYEADPQSIDDWIKADNTVLLGFTESQRRATVDLVLSGLFEAERSSDGPLRFRSKYHPYAHQAEMTRRGLRQGAPGIVTTGTGSGKTEAFLLPILAQIAKEASHWASPEDGYLTRRWWHDPATRKPWVSEKTGKVAFTGIPNHQRPSTKILWQRRS